MRGSLAGLLLLYSAILLPATGYIMQEISYCGYGEEEGNVTFLYAITFNHLLAVGYDSEENMFLPYQSIPEMLAVVRGFTTEFNSKPDMLNYVKSEEKRCQDQIKTFWNNTAQRRVKPSMEVFSPVQSYGENLPLLICHVWGFYPQDIVVAWIKNEKTLVKNVTVAVRVGDWTYQVVAKLDLRDSLPEDTYSCVVRHESLDTAMMKSWRAGLTFLQIITISVSAAILALGLLSLVVGVVCWRGAGRSDVGLVLPCMSCPWRCTCLLPLLWHRDPSLSDPSMSLLSCDSRSLLEEASDADSIEGQLVRGESSRICTTAEPPAAPDQGCYTPLPGYNETS